MEKERPMKSVRINRDGARRIPLFIVLVALLFTTVVGCANQQPSASPTESQNAQVVATEDEGADTQAEASPGEEAASEEDARIEQVVEDMIDQAGELEPAVTEVMKGFESDTAHLEGLEFRIKSKSSLQEKIARKVREKGLGVEEAAAGIADTLRYTLVIDDDEYVATTKAILDSLVEQGYSVAEFENHWADVDYDYQGINTKLRCPEGLLIELQFHTPDSYDTKQEKTHKYYEIIRSEDATEEEKAEAARIQHELFAQVPVPEGVMEFTYET